MTDLNATCASLRTLVADLLNAPVDAASERMALSEIALGNPECKLDSLDVLRLGLEIEKRYGINLPAEHAELGQMTLRELAEVINELSRE